MLLVVAWAFFGCGWIRTSLLLQASHIFNVTANLDLAVEFRRALQNRVCNALTGVFNASDSLVNLTEHPCECAFEATLHNLMAIRVGPHPDCGMTEVHILTAKSDYKEFSLQTATGLILTDTRKWASNGLMAISVGMRS